MHRVPKWSANTQHNKSLGFGHFRARVDRKIIFGRQDSTSHAYTAPIVGKSRCPNFQGLSPHHIDNSLRKSLC
ncbi:hypothetical protein EUGRSUZ_B00271 [Eucalyptus grandis]|uniref:Uncharacterized protein n=2 Tax=Eucalyptus grandis TaxID=71139 RepID=A0ACC3LMN0_EUCGR|nr:hypothetical protein EUGRSUZ_B00271 [Eucalyptus grandis]